MKKMMLLGVLALAAGSAFAQESRQDASMSFVTTAAPNIFGAGGIQQHSSISGGFLASYRYMLTPRSALELNYGWLHNSQYFQNSTNTASIHTRQQEFTGAYVYTRNYRRYNPFAEIGVGALIFTPMRDYGSTSLDAKSNTRVGGLAGLGLAYEVSPSFDVRLEYRGFITKAPNFNLDQFKTNRYEWVSLPALGVAYHF